MPEVNRVHIPGTKLTFLWQRPKETHLNITDYTLINALRNLSMLNGFQVNSGTPDFDFDASQKGSDYLVELCHGMPTRLITPIGSYNLYLQVYGGLDAERPGDVTDTIKTTFLGREVPSTENGFTLISINPAADLSRLEHRLMHQGTGGVITVGNYATILFSRDTGRPIKATA